MDEETEWLNRTFWECFPHVSTENAWQWCQKHFRAVGSARSETFDIDTTPWLKEPFQCLTDGVTKTEVVIGPAQSGKSVLGEGAICFWIGTEPNGDVQYNWEDDQKGKERFVTRVKKVLKACDAVEEKWPRGRSEGKECLVVFPHMNFTMQGVKVQSNLESASIRFQVNEEVHDWEPGRLRLADKRQTAYWNAFQLNLSTGGSVGDQLHQRWENSTKRHWLEQCPHCGAWQIFHVRKHKGVLGGLCYDLDGSKDVNGVIDYEKLEQSIYYECEKCGQHMFDNTEERRQRSLHGKYEECSIKNSVQGFRWEGISVYWIKWIDIVREKLEAYAAMKRGDIQPWKTYLQRVEAAFWNPNDRPLAELVKLTEGVKLREGIKDRLFRAMTVDFQAGSQRAGTAQHFKIIIRDWTAELNSQLVFEGIALTDAELDDIRQKFEVDPNYVLIDSGYNAPFIYQVCWKYGYLSIKGASDKNYFKYALYDSNGSPLQAVYRVYSNIQQADPFVGDQEGREGRYQVQLMFYSKQGIRDILELIRAQHEWIIPEDVSEQYKKEICSEELRDFKHPKTGELVQIWCKVSEHAQNDYFVCEAYQALFVTMMSDAGLLQLTEELKPRERTVVSEKEMNNA